MAFLKIKSGAVVSRQVIIAAAVVNAANSLDFHQDMMITSGNDSRHMPGSKHYTDEALDFRTKTLTKTQQRALADTVQRRLGRHYDVVLESDHLHVEYDQEEEA